MQENKGKTGREREREVEWMKLVFNHNESLHKVQWCSLSSLYTTRSL